MRLFATILLVAFAAVAFTAVEAGDKGKEVKLKGTITRAKSDPGKDAKCATLNVNKEHGKDVVYYFDPTSSKKYHKEICTDAKPGTVEGTCKAEGDKKVVTATKVTFEKK